jgi:hypothetical protein
MREPTREEIVELFWHLEIAFDSGFTYLSGSFVTRKSGSNYRKPDFTHRDLDSVIDIRKKLGELKENSSVHYEVLRLKFGQGFEPAEIAEKLEISEESVHDSIKLSIPYFLRGARIPFTSPQFKKPQRESLSLGTLVIVLQDEELRGKVCEVQQIFGLLGDRVAVKYSDHGRELYREVPIDWIDW